jgi:hypothetical protein
VRVLPGLVAEDDADVLFELWTRAIKYRHTIREVESLVSASLRVVDMVLADGMLISRMFHYLTLH